MIVVFLYRYELNGYIIVYYFLDVNREYGSHNSDKKIIQVCRRALFVALFNGIRNGRKNAEVKE